MIRYNFFFLFLFVSFCIFSIGKVFAQSGNEISTYLQRNLYNLETLRLMGGRYVDLPRNLNPKKTDDSTKNNKPQTNNPERTGHNSKENPDEGWQQNDKIITRGICKDKAVKDCKFQKNTISRMTDLRSGLSNTVLLKDNQKIENGTKSLQKGKIIRNIDEEIYYVEKIKYNGNRNKFEGIGKIIFPDNKAISELPLPI